MKSDLIELSVSLIAETDKAVLVSETGDKKDAVWLPKSQIEIDSDGLNRVVIVTMREGLAKEKGLI